MNFNRYRVNKLKIKLEGLKSKSKNLVNLTNLTSNSYYADQLLIVDSEIAKTEEKIRQLSLKNSSRTPN